MLSASLIILSGGRSRRMQENKAFIRVGGKRIIDIMMERFRAVFLEVLIISNEPELYAEFGVPVYPDIYPCRVPLAGVHTGLVRANCEVATVIACDMPFISLELLEYMLNRRGNHQVVVPRINGLLQPLAAVYHRSCINRLEKCLQNDWLKLVRVIETLDHTVVSEEELAQLGTVEELLMNVNDPDALIQAQSIWDRHSI